MMHITRMLALNDEKPHWRLLFSVANNNFVPESYLHLNIIIDHTDGHVPIHHKFL